MEDIMMCCVVGVGTREIDRAERVRDARDAT